ncbi:MAG: VWA domain-containing protein [Terracidiphilus sp.]
MPQQHADMPDIVLDLVAQDKKNRPVVNLTASDIAAMDGGTRVELKDLRLVTAQSGAQTRIALFFDSMSADAAKSARVFAVRLLAEAPQATEFAVFGVDRGLRLLETYTADRAALKAAVMLVPDKIPTTSLSNAERAVNSIVQNGTFPDGKAASVDERANAKLMLGALEDSQKLVVERRIPSALAGMQAIAGAERGLSGRQIMVFFSEGFRTTSKTMEQTKDAVEAANRAGVTIYTVDTMGVATKSFDMVSTMNRTGPQLAAQNSVVPSGTWQPSLTVYIAQATGIHNDATDADHLQRDDDDNANGDLLARLANGTGGFVVSTGDDPRKPLKRLLNDAGSYYEASYTPALKQNDGSFHSLDVRALRAGVRIRARSGYFAVSPDEEGLTPVRPSEAPLVKLLANAAPADGIAFDQAVLEVADSAQGRVTDELAVEVPVSHLGLHSDDQTKLYAVRASILAEVKDKSGVVVERFQQDIARNGALESIAAARIGSVTLQRHFEEPPGAYTVETAVLDRVSGKTGVERAEFTVAAAKSPWMSDVVMLGRSQPLNGAPDPLEPLVYRNARVVPNIGHRVQAGAEQAAFLVRVRSDSTAGDGTLAFDVDRDGRSVTHSVEKIVAAPNAATSMDVASIDARKLTAGEYSATFRFTQGAKIETRSLTFSVEGNPGDKAAAADFADEDTESYPADGNATTAGKFEAAAGANAPSPLTQKALLDGARERADGFLGSLMNFECLEITDRYVDHKGNGKAHHDRIVELLKSENHKESRRVLQVDGKPADADSVDMTGARLSGAFGGVLQIVIQPAANAHFEWKQNGYLDGAAVEVFSYSVDAKHSRFSVVPMPLTPVLVPFHGMVYIDAATHGVRRITVEADGIPAHSPIHATAISIDYDYVTLNDHDYLVPVRGEMRMQIGKREKILHTIEFRDYHRFGSQLRILGMNP